MKLGKLGLAASAVTIMTLAAAAGLHNARAQGFDDEGGRDRTWATKSSTDAQGAHAAGQTATDSKSASAASNSWRDGESATDADYNRRSHSLTRATPGTGVKTPPWASPADAKTAASSLANEGTAVKTDNGWAHQGTWKGPAPDHSAELQVNTGIGPTSAATAPDNQTSSAPATTGGPAPSLASPSE